MACEPWAEKLDAYLDGELSAEQARGVDEHLRGCSSCAAEALRRVQQKRMVQAAGQKFVASHGFRARVEKSIAPPAPWWRQRWLPILATAAALLLGAALVLNINHGPSQEERLIGELADLHVATLASSSPVDVVSTDRHTVKPWFAGRIPFTFNLPELQDSPFTLVGGRVSYLGQSPGAELIYRVHQHQISVFIFQDRGFAATPEKAATELSFEVRNWTHNGLRYFVIGDASGQDLDKLSELIKGAG